MPPVPTLALVRDLMLGSRITAAARAVGVPLKTVRDPAGLANQPGDRLIVDLNLPEAIPAAVAWQKASAGRETIGFVSHVDAETVRAAREQGIGRVVARSKFVEILPEWLKGEKPRETPEEPQIPTGGGVLGGETV